MNIYEWIREVSKASLDHAAVQEGLDLADHLEKIGAFGNAARNAEGKHRYTPPNQFANFCGLCDAPESEHLNV